MLIDLDNDYDDRIRARIERQAAEDPERAARELEDARKSWHPPVPKTPRKRKSEK